MRLFAKRGFLGKARRPESGLRVATVQRAACSVPIDFSAGAGKNRSLAVQERKGRDRIFEEISRARSTSQRHYAGPPSVYQVDPKVGCAANPGGLDPGTCHDIFVDA
jgi:hypothetical protein